MTKPISSLILSLAIACSCSAYAASATKALRQDGGTTSSVEVNDGEGVATIRGSEGIALMMDDSVQLTRRTVSVNGRSYGAVPEVCEIKYVVTKTARTLYVDGKPRNPPIN